MGNENFRWSTFTGPEVDAVTHQQRLADGPFSVSIGASGGTESFAFPSASWPIMRTDFSTANMTAPSQRVKSAHELLRLETSGNHPAWPEVVLQVDVSAYIHNGVEFKAGGGYLGLQNQSHIQVRLNIGMVKSSKFSG